MEIETRHGTKVLEVSAIPEEAPEYATKAILRVMPHPPEAA